jgi:hypothetical protein
MFDGEQYARHCEESDEATEKTFALKDWMLRSQ